MKNSLENIIQIKPLEWQYIRAEWDRRFKYYKAVAANMTFNSWKDKGKYYWSVRGLFNTETTSLKEGKKLCEEYYEKIIRDCLVVPTIN